jgi:hypothetical protein
LWEGEKIPFRAYCTGEGEVAAQPLKLCFLIFLKKIIFNPKIVVKLDGLCAGERSLWEGTYPRMKRTEG